MIQELDAFDREVAEAAAQNSQAWVDVRIGRFTASEMYRLMSHGYRPMTAEELKARPKKGTGSKVTQVVNYKSLGTGAESYIIEKVAETLTGMTKFSNDSIASLNHGKETEPFAIQSFCDKTGMTHEPIGFVPFGDHAGGSPDGIINKLDIIEVKCPYALDSQLGYLMLTDQYDLKRIYPEYYWQCQSNLLFTENKGVCHFVTYDTRYNDEKMRLTHLIVKPNAEDQQLICDKIALAVKEKLEIIQRLTS